MFHHLLDDDLCRGHQSQFVVIEQLFAMCFVRFIQECSGKRCHTELAGPFAAAFRVRLHARRKGHAVGQQIGLATLPTRGVVTILAFDEFTGGFVVFLGANVAGRIHGSLVSHYNDEWRIPQYILTDDVGIRWNMVYIGMVTFGVG